MNTKFWFTFLADSINWYRKGQVRFAEERVTTINLARVVMSLLKLGIGVYNLGSDTLPGPEYYSQGMPQPQS